MSSKLKQPVLNVRTNLHVTMSAEGKRMTTHEIAQLLLLGDGRPSPETDIATNAMGQPSRSLADMAGLVSNELWFHRLVRHIRERKKELDSSSDEDLESGSEDESTVESGSEDESTVESGSEDWSFVELGSGDESIATDYDVTPGDDDATDYEVTSGDDDDVIVKVVGKRTRTEGATCEYCAYTSDRKHNMRRHMQTRHNIVVRNEDGVAIDFKRYKCIDCDKRWINRSDLRRHQNTNIHHKRRRLAAGQLLYI